MTLIVIQAYYKVEFDPISQPYGMSLLISLYRNLPQSTVTRTEG